MAADAPVVGGVPPERVEEVLRERYRLFHNNTVAEKHSSMAKAATETRISHRMAQLQRITAAVDGILHKEQSGRDEERRRDIYRHVSAHLKELAARCAEKKEDGQRMDCVLGELLHVEMELEQRVREQARRVGVDGLFDLDDIEHQVKRLDQGYTVVDEDVSFF